MKRVVGLLLLTILAQGSYCQVVAIQTEISNIAYICYGNPLKVAVEGCSSRNILLTHLTQRQEGIWCDRINILPMDKQMLDIYSDYLISSFSYTTATGLSDALGGVISHDKITRFLSAGDYDSKQLWKLVKPTIRRAGTH